MKIHRILTLVLFGSYGWGSQITVQMLNLPVSSAKEPDFFVFDVNGQIWKLLCDEFVPSITSLPYTARVATLDDLAGTRLVRAGDPEALKRYQWIAILDLLAYADPTLATDVAWANRYIAGDTRNLTPAAANLVAFVQAQDPKTYDLTGFRIFYGITHSGDFLDTQEQTGFPAIPPSAPTPVPEPATLSLALLGFASYGLCRVAGRWRGSKERDNSSFSVRTDSSF